MLSRTGSILVPFFVTWLLGCSLLEPEPLLLIDGRGYDPRPPEALAETTPEVMDAWLGQSIDFHLLYHQAQRVLPDLYRRYLVQALLEAETASVRLTNQEVMNYLHPRYGRKVAELDLRRAAHILLPGDASSDAGGQEQVHREAEALHARILAGEDFATLARTFSRDTTYDRGGDLGYLRRDAVVKPFGDLLFSFSELGQSGVVRTEYGWHVVRCTGTNETFRAELFDQLLKEKKRRLVAHLLERLREESTIVMAKDFERVGL